MASPFLIDKFSISDYLLVVRLLDNELLSWEEAKIKVLSTRITNQVSNIRKIIGSFKCIENIKFKTTNSSYDKYKMNVEYKEHFQQLKKQYESNSKFMFRVHKRLENIRA